MSRSAPKLLIALFILSLSTLPAVAAQPAAADVTGLFRDAAPAIDQLRVVDVGGILIIRGRTLDRANAEAAGQYAQSLGYSRIANLIQITEPADDVRILRLAERELAIHRSLHGCHISLVSQNGVVHMAGQVQHELQKDMAVQLVSRINGVKAVHSDLQRF